MNNLESLVILMAEAERARDLALAEQIRLKSADAAARTQADELLVYRREYEQRWSAQFCREGQIELVRCYQGFMLRLTEAIEQQTRTAAHAALQLARAEATLREHEVRAAAVRKLIERRVSEGQRAAERQQQKTSDELASRVAWSRAAAARQARAE